MPSVNKIYCVKKKKKKDIVPKEALSNYDPKLKEHFVRITMLFVSEERLTQIIAFTFWEITSKNKQLQILKRQSSLKFLATSPKLYTLIIYTNWSRTSIFEDSHDEIKKLILSFCSICQKTAWNNFTMVNSQSRTLANRHDDIEAKMLN